MDVDAAETGHGAKREVAAYIAVGSNIEPEKNILRACLLLGEAARVCSVSSFYRTEPVDRPGQPEYRNGVLEIRTSATPQELKFRDLRKIEERLGRVRDSDKNANRTIDLDVVLYGDAVLREKDLLIPDPDIRTRAFIAVPLLELAPDLCLPDTGERLSGLASAKRRSDMVPDDELTQTLKSRLGL